MQCKILNLPYASLNNGKAEQEINSWLSQGWKIVNTFMAGVSYVHVVLVK